ncbi:hypothetical protein NLJ89_g7985 [Agrocybe chaxingu]|uniref:Uncharacterized protein n=1 Tax=Agrocybe chaxingu TaxID=84603 RepID=A0A9W8JW87_9AGAR|nr:hypothetical protein NLJ89_g7985 [Agrocybe chaxingu]
MGLFWMCLKYNQRLLVYPDGFNFDNERREIATPLSFSMPYEDVELQTKDKVTLRCYLLLQTSKVIYGQSLGGGVAIDVTSRNAEKIKALIIENTFTSIPNVIKGWPVIGYFSFLATQRWPAASRLESIPASLPILMLSGALDAVIPQHHMHTLWDVASKRGQPKGNLLNAVTCGTMSRRVSVLVAGDEEVSGKGCSVPPVKDKFKGFSRGSHNDTCLQPEYWTTVFDFLDDVLS